jgi:hypothetical protein
VRGDPILLLTCDLPKSFGTRSSWSAVLINFSTSKSNTGDFDTATYFGLPTSDFGLPTSDSNRTFPFYLAPFPFFWASDFRLQRTFPSLLFPFTSPLSRNLFKQLFQIFVLLMHLQYF